MEARNDIVHEEVTIMDFYEDAKSAFESNYRPGDLHPEMVEYGFTDVVPGKKCNNGGEYGFFTDLYPSSLPGVFFVETRTTCDFDDCGTGPQGYAYLTADDIRRMEEESDAIEAMGSRY